MTGSRSSSSWNTVRIPNTDPMTAKLPTAATAEPPADTADAPHSWSDAANVLVPQ